MTLLGRAIRAHRTGAIAMAVIGGIAGLLNGVGYVQIAGNSPAERHLLELLGRKLSYLLPLGGYLTWHDFGSIALLYTIWATLAGTGAARGDEERGLVETWLSAGVSRLRWLAVRSAGFLIAALLSVAVAIAVTALGAALAGEPLAADALALEGLAVLALALFGFGLGVAVAQLFVTRRAASAAGGVVILGLFLLNAAGRAGTNIGQIRNLSPFYLFDRSTPLLVGGGLDLAATAALLAAAVVLVALAAIGFARRDHR